MAQIHKTPHPLVGQTVKITGNKSIVHGEDFWVEDWADRVIGTSWMEYPVVIAANYAIETDKYNLPIDNEVVYGKVGSLSYLVHESQLER